MTQTDFAAGKNTRQFRGKCVCQGKLCLKEWKYISLVLFGKFIDQKEEENILKNSHSFLATHFSSNSARKRNLKVMLEKDHFFYLNENIALKNKLWCLQTQTGYLMRHCSEMSFSFFWCTDTALVILKSNSVKTSVLEFSNRNYFIFQMHTEHTSTDKPLNIYLFHYLRSIFTSWTHLYRQTICKLWNVHFSETIQKDFEGQISRVAQPV